MSRWQKLRAAVFRMSPTFNPTVHDYLTEARNHEAAAAYDYCAERMQTWSDLTVARGGKPDWAEFHTILNGWRLGAHQLTRNTYPDGTVYVACKP
jgi:hypothetical protein